MYSKYVGKLLTRARESATIIRVLSETERQREEWESFVVAKMADFWYDLIGSCWHGEAAGW